MTSFLSFFKRRACLLVCLLVCATSAQALKPDRKLTYKTAGDVKLKLDVFNPQGLAPTDQRPAIVFFFGGSWVNGKPAQFHQQARDLADLGMVAFAANYRVKKRNQTTPFESVRDAKSAVRWIREHAAELGVDPERIVASGGSAGGHLAVCTALIEGEEDEGENLAISSVPDAVVAFNPVLDTTAKGFGLKSVGEDRQFDISPCHQVRPGIPPTLVLHGTADRIVPFENAERFTRLMHEAGNRCDLDAYEGQDHAFFNHRNYRKKIKDPAIYDQCMKTTVDFLTSLGYIDRDAK